MESEERDIVKETQDFLEMTGSKFCLRLSRHGQYFSGDDQSRDIYECIIINSSGKEYIFEFGQSISCEGIEPLPHEVLGCLETYDYASFESFCDELGYDPDSRSAEAVYDKVNHQVTSLTAMYNENELECLRRLRD